MEVSIEMIQDLELISLVQKIEGEEELLKEIHQRLERENFVDPDRKFLYFDTEQIQKMMEPIFEKLKLDVKIIQAWVHVLEPGAAHTTHNHEHDTGVYYLQALKNCGNLYFDDLDIEIPIEEDLFIVVPAREKHSITKNNTRHQRIALVVDMEEK